MKKLIVLFLLTFLSWDGKTQINTPFPDSTGAWTWSCGGMNCNAAYRYYVSGDTTINSTPYHVLRIGNTNLFDSSLVTGSTNILGYYREDSLRIYFLDDSIVSSGGPFGFFSYNYEYFGLNSEVLLYDFAIQVNDTFLLSPIFGQNVVLTSIDSVLLNSFYYKRWNFSGYGSYNWIEGIGSSIGFLPYYYFFEDGVGLNCFHEQSENIIFDLNGATSCQTVGYKEDIRKKDLWIFPNPNSSDVITLELGYDINEPKIFISDILGKTLKVSIEINDSGVKISTKDLSDGIYFVTVITGNIIQVEKIILE